MELTSAASYAVLVVSAALLFYVGANDLKNFKVPNELVFALAGLFFLYAILSGGVGSLHLNVGFALLMFVVLLFCYSLGWMGGGDVKLLTVAFLWLGKDCALPFAVLMLAFAVLHLIAARFRWVQVREADGRRKIAFAPSIAGALILSFMFCVPYLHQ